MLKVAENAYDGGEAPKGYILQRRTPTLVFYRKVDNPNDVLLGVRGTASLGDVGADLALGVGLLRFSGRYRADKRAVEDYLKEFPGAKIYTGGHSLGAAVARQLARDFPEHIKGGAGYNAAIGLDELLSSKRLKKGKQVRHTTKADPLYQLSRPFLKPEDRPFVVDSGTSNPLEAHKTSNFDAEGDNA